MNGPMLFGPIAFGPIAFGPIAFGPMLFEPIFINIFLFEVDVISWAYLSRNASYAKTEKGLTVY